MKKILILILFTSVCFAQNHKPEDVLEMVKENFSKVKDYEVNVKIKVDVNFLKVPDSQAKIFYKQPDKIKLKSDGFALLPKEGLNFSPYSFLEGDYTSIFDKEQEIEGHPCYLVKVIPLGDRGDLILTTLWIDKDKYIIRRIESTTKTNGTFSIDLKYDNNLKYPLPSSMVFTFNVQKMQMPKEMTGDMTEQNSEEKEKGNIDKTTTGKVYINYSDYKVNVGLPDTIFNEDKK
jgi:outer membrane lipoprotein-sorting protein